MLDGANHFAYGAHGRWEIIAAQTVTTESNGTYTLRDLLRGRFGTERHMTTHGATDQIVRLDPDRLRFVGMDVSSINVSRLWRAVTRGAPLDSASDTALTYSGVNLETLAPISVKGSKSPSGDWTIGWTRRTRTPVEPFSGVAAPLAESSESYDVEIYSDSTYGTLKRTLSGLTSASATYTSAQQTTDFGAVQKFLYVKVYQLSATVGRGYPAAAVVGPTHLINLKSLIHFDAGGSGYIPYRVLGLHFDGANGSTTISDVTGKTVTNTGSVAISTAQYASLTGNAASVFINGSGKYLSLANSSDFDFGTGDFSISLWVMIPTGATFVDNTIPLVVAGRMDVSASGGGWNFNIMGASRNQIRFEKDLTTGTAVSKTWTLGSSIALDTWYHLELWRSSGTINVAVNGTAQTADGSIFNGISLPVPNSLSILIGGGGNISNINYYPFTGYLDDLEIIKGSTIHTSGFSVPSAPFPDTAPSIIDKVGNAVTVTGTAAVVSNASSFGGYCLQANQASGYVSTPVIDLTADRWTIDLWITPDAMPSSGNQSGVFRYGTGDSGLGGLSVVIRSTGSARCYFGALVSPIETSVAPFAAGVRSHLFIMRDGPRFYIGAAGTVGENKLVSDTAFVGNKGFDIGYALAASLDPKALKIDEWRVFSGEASYPTSGNYLPPTFPFPDP